jgi:hypothetical protein
MERCTKANGKMIFSMVRALKLGLIRANTKASTRLEESMGLERISGTTGANILAIGEKIK